MKAKEEIKEFLSVMSDEERKAAHIRIDKLRRDGVSAELIADSEYWHSERFINDMMRSIHKDET